MRKPRLITVIEPDASLRRLFERVMERAAPGVPARSGASLDECAGASGLMIYDLAAGWDELIKWRRRHPSTVLVLFLGAIAGFEQSALKTLHPAACFALPFPYSELEEFIRQVCCGGLLKGSRPVVSWRVAG